MEFVQDNDVLQVIRKFNPWWTDKKYTAGASFKRMAFYEVYGWFRKENFNRAVVLSGARRVGKTVILRQVAEELMKEGWLRNEILYLSLDHPILKLANLDRIIDIYQQNVLPNPKKIALLLDEVQYAKNWGTWIKHSIDFRPSVRIIATGSAALDIQDKGTESGTGRWVTVKIPTLSYYEYLRMKDIDIPKLAGDFRVLNLVKMERPSRAEIMNSCLPVKEYFHKYLLVGGFPELVKMENIDDAQRLLREDVVEKVLKRDMTTSFGVRHVAEIEKLFIYLCIHSGGIVEKKTLADQLEVSPITVERFLGYLESANLIYRLPPIQQSGKMALKGRPKIHVSDIALRNAVLLKSDDILTNPEELGLSVESAVYKHFHTFYFREKPIMGYWREGKREVDIVINVENQTIPIEVKYRERPQVKRKDGLWFFSEAAGVKNSIIVSKNAEDFDVVPGPAANSKILIIPAFLLLFMLGHSERNMRKVSSK